MTGTPILVLAVVLFVVSFILERILEHLVARRKRPTAHLPATGARPKSALPQRASGGGLAASSQAASLSADTDGRLQASSREHGLDHDA